LTKQLRRIQGEYHHDGKDGDDRDDHKKLNKGEGLREDTSINLYLKHSKS
jgi:hypothetical protein